MTKPAEVALIIGAGLCAGALVAALVGFPTILAQDAAKLEVHCPDSAPLSIIIHDPQGAREMGCRAPGGETPPTPPAPPADGILRQSWPGPYTSSGVCGVPGGDDPSTACPEQVKRLRWRLPKGEYKAVRLSFTWTLPETCISSTGAAKCAGAWWVLGGNEKMWGYLVSGQWHDKAGVWRWGWVKSQGAKAKETINRLPRRAPLRVVMTAHAQGEWVALEVKEVESGRLVYRALVEHAAHLPAAFTASGKEEVYVDLGFTGFDNSEEGAGGEWSDVLMEALP